MWVLDGGGTGGAPALRQPERAGHDEKGSVERADQAHPRRPPLSEGEGGERGAQGPLRQHNGHDGGRVDKTVGDHRL